MLGSASITIQLDEGHWIVEREHNDQVDKNWHVLSKIIDCVKFYRAFELALRSHDMTENFTGIFRGLVDLVSSLDNMLEEHLKTTTVFH